MRTIDADKVIEKLKEHKNLFCKNRDEFRALSDKDKARVDEIDTCIAELVNAEEVQTTNTDTISRQAAIDALVAETIYTEEELREYYETNSHRNEWVNGIYEAVEVIKQLPPAQPKRGRWIGKYPVTSVCSECGFLIHDSKVKAFAYCPNCGADMRGEQDE